MTDPGLSRQLPVPATEVSVMVLEQPAFRAPPIARGRDKEQHLIMAESVPPHPFDDMEALAWLRSSSKDA